MDPLRALEREASRRDDAVEVRVVEQILAPGMEDRKKSNLCSQVTRIAGYLLQSLRTGAEQQIIEDLLVLQHEFGKVGEAG